MFKVCCKEFGPPQTLERVEVATPQPEADEILVQIDAAGVGFVDGLMIQGLYQVKPPLPYFPGSEFAGVITQLGSNVSEFRVGDSVMGLATSGAFADYLCVPAKTVIRLPDELDTITAAGMYINYATALYGLRDCGNLREGENILILGAAGGVGSAAIAVAKAMGAHVIAAASTPAKRSAAKDSGADTVLDYSAQNWRDELKQLTANHPLTLVYDPVGGPFSEPAFRSLAPGGRLLVVGFAAGEIPKIPLNLALLKRASIIGVDWGGESRANPGINGELMTTLMGWVSSGKLKPAQVATRPMSDYQQALTDQLAGQIVGKLVLVNR